MAGADDVSHGSSSSYKAPLKSSGSSGGGLARSHSSPNIAKMVEQEQDAANQLPRQPPPDRSTKPQMCVIQYMLLY